MFLPIWAAYPAVGFSGRDVLPGLRSDAADRVAGPGRPVTWPLAFLHLVAESARMGLRELAAAFPGRRRRRRSAKLWPNFWHQRRTVSYETPPPRSAKSSSTSRRLDLPRFRGVLSVWDQAN